jgi:ubiquinone/menaquinone biosynthesis C-methylase UbiE
VLCSVEDPARALQEVLRVLRPGGRFLFLEHVAAPEGSWLRRLQALLNPLQRLVCDGCNVNRCTWQTIERAGFGAVDMAHCRVGNCPLLATLQPHIMGIATK